MVHITYQELVSRYGIHTASGLLLSIERWANVNSDMTKTDEEKRLSVALERLNAQEVAS